MTEYFKCGGKTLDECWKCNMYYAYHSWHYNKIYKEEVTELSCNIGGNRVFNKAGKRIDNKTWR